MKRFLGSSNNRFDLIRRQVLALSLLQLVIWTFLIMSLLLELFLGPAFHIMRRFRFILILTRSLLNVILLYFYFSIAILFGTLINGHSQFDGSLSPRKHVFRGEPVVLNSQWTVLSVEVTGIKQRQPLLCLDGG